MPKLTMTIVTNMTRGAVFVIDFLNKLINVALDSPFP